MGNIHKMIGIGEKIKRLRKERGFTQKAFSELVNITYSTYSNYENGNREPSQDQLEKIASALGVTVYDLIGVSPNPRQSLKEDIAFFNYLESNGCMVSDFFEGADYALYLESENVTIPLSSTELQTFKDNMKDDLEMEIKRLRKQKGL